MADKKGTSQFVVDLGDLELPADAARNLNTEIRKLVLSRIAELDFKGDLRVAASLPKELGPRTDGIWIDVIKSL
jgi:hypothetical protein